MSNTPTAVAGVTDFQRNGYTYTTCMRMICILIIYVDMFFNYFHIYIYIYMLCTTHMRPQNCWPGATTWVQRLLGLD